MDDDRRLSGRSRHAAARRRGGGWNATMVHVNVFYGIPLGYPTWIALFIFVLAAGVIFGGLGYLITWRRR